MNAFVIHPAMATAAEIEGLIVTHTVRRSGRKGVLFRKGQRLTAADLTALREAGGEVHALAAETGEVHEDEAGALLARLAAGPGLLITGPTESQYHLAAQYRGLFRVDLDVLREVNLIDGLSVFTTFDNLPVDEGEVVGAAKVTPILISRERLDRAAQLCRERPPLTVKRFRAQQVAALVVDRVDLETRARFERDLRQKLSWFGATLLDVEAVPNRVDAFVRAIEECSRAGVDIIMAAGASSLDPLEPLFLALAQAGARIEKHGVPAHPGSLFWLASIEGKPVFGLSSCEMFSHKTILDLILPRLLAGEVVGRNELVELAHGGLLTRYMAFRFPSYDRGPRGT